MEGQQDRSPPGDPGWAEMETISQNIQILPQDTLRRICKGPLTEFTRECKDNQKISRLWQCLLQTFSSASISMSHATTARNAISGFIDAAQVSTNEETRQLVLSPESWLAVFEVYLDRFDDGKPKPMKQVLNSLVKILVKHPDPSEAESIRPKIGDATIPSIMLGEPRSRVKASLVALELFVHKNAVPASDLILMVSNWLVAHHKRWIPLFQEHCKALSIDTAQFTKPISTINIGDKEFQITAARIFALGLLVQAKNPEFISAVGTVLATLCQKMNASPEAEKGLDSEPQKGSAIWVAPVKHILLQNLDNLEALSNNILHPLFSVDPKGFRSFIHQLPVKSLLSGDMTDAPLDQFVLLFSSLQMAKKLGLVHEDNLFSKAHSAKKEESDTIILNSEILGQFLLHKEPSIRIGTLSLLITAPSTTKPLSSPALRTILRGLPYMHAESDPQIRGELLSLTRKLIERLRGGMSKTKQDAVHDRAKGGPPADTSNLESYPFLQAKSISDKREFDSRTFLETYLNFLEEELRPTASYQRHITALKALSLVLHSGVDPRISDTSSPKTEGDLAPWPCSFDVFRPSLFRLLVDLLLDPFEDVRATSLSLLNLFPRDFLMTDSHPAADGSSVISSRLIDALEKAERLASNTSRADHADTVARLYHVLFTLAKQCSLPPELSWYTSKAGVVNFILKKLEAKLSRPGGLFTSSMRDAPLHGYVSALRYIVTTTQFYSTVSDPSDKAYSSWRSVQERILSVCDRIWDEVKPVLCIDAPEGHSNEPVDDLNVGPKDILSYSWRALRESSLLLHATLANQTYGPKGEHGLKRADYEKIGVSSFTQLAELRHRGAFSTVSQTFATCCQRCAQSDDPAISSLPSEWYQEVRSIIYEQASRLTRRSAGLPSLVTGILSSNPTGPLFQQVMAELHDIAQLPATRDVNSYEIKLPQVHAMNCLKDIFTNARLGPHTERFVMSALKISAECLSSSIWAICNCGLMLFRALITRMCRLTPGTGGLGFGGVTGSEPAMRLAFQKYPGLINLLAGLLTPAGRSENSNDPEAPTATEKVFPALELIGEKIPSRTGGEERKLQGLVLHHIKSSVWAIREHAARVYASLLNRSHILKEVRNLLAMDDSIQSQNHLHGKALSIRYAMQRLELARPGYWKDHLGEIVFTVQDAFGNLFLISRSPFVQAALLDVFNDTVEKAVRFDAGDVSVLINPVFEKYALSNILDCLLDVSRPPIKSLNDSRPASLLRRSLAWATILKIITMQKSDDLPLPEFFQQVSSADSDAARWILGRTLTVLRSKEAYRSQLLDLYASVICGSYPEDVKTAAVSNMAILLEDILESCPDAVKDLIVPWEALGSKIYAESQTQTWSREMVDAELRLHGCLLAIRALTSTQWESSQEFTLDLSKWIIKLRYAMEEETEFTTRYSAVMSLKSFGCVLRSPGGKPRTIPAFLDIYLILYDMLNDDDEELRDISAAVASWVLSYSSVSPDKAVALSPMPSTDLLAEFIARDYTASPRLSRDAIRRLTGQTIKTSGSGSPTKLAAVSDLLSEYRKESTVLFVEEKQNLFIDDVREVDIWARALSKLSSDAYEETWLKIFSQWVSDGLSCFIETTNSATGKDGLLGWTSKPETFTLGVRLISAAAVLASKDFPAESHLSDDKATLKTKLQSLLESGRAASLHEQWLSRIELATAL